MSKFSFFPLVVFLHCVLGVVSHSRELSDVFFPFLDAVEVKVEKATESLLLSLQLEVPTATQV